MTGYVMLLTIVPALAWFAADFSLTMLFHTESAPRWYR